MARVDLPQTAGTRARLDRDPSTGRFLPRTLAASGCSPSTRFSIHPLLHQCISPPRSHPNAPRSTADTDTACSRMSSMPTLRRLGPIVTDLEHSTLSGHARVHAHPCPSQPRASPLLPRHRPKTCLLSRRPAHLPDPAPSSNLSSSLVRPCVSNPRRPRYGRGYVHVYDGSSMAMAMAMSPLSTQLVRYGSSPAHPNPARSTLARPAQSDRLPIPLIAISRRADSPSIAASRNSITRHP